MANEVTKELISLIHLDIDAVHAYDQAIKEIDVVDIRDSLESFKKDHLQHITDLSAIVRQQGGEVPQFKPDFKGFLIQGFTALRSKTGTEGALKAMRGNELLTNATYEKALKMNLPPDVMTVVQKNREDERRHLKYIQDCLDQRSYENKAA